MRDDPDAAADHVAAAPGTIDPCGLELLGILERRRSVAPLRLVAPGPSPDEIRRLLTAATRVPDHGALAPWRLIVVQDAARQELSDRLAAAFLTTNPAQEPATADVAIRKIKAVFAAPLVVIVVSCADPAARIPEWEQILSAGAVCMNVIVAASALGYGSNWLTGWTAYDAAASRLLGIRPGEKVAGIIPIGTVSEPPHERPRPALEALVTVWKAPP
jgi:nitroreductase